MAALAELMWNALDAEASDVRVEFVENELEGLQQVRIIDNGHGLHYDDAFIVFKNLGGSWKREGFRSTSRRRVLHGKFGKGRFRAFSLGNHVAWKTQFVDGDDCQVFTIEGNARKLGEFTITDRRRLPEPKTGMTVEISDLPASIGLLRGVKAVQEVTDIFAPYMRQYPDVKISYDNVRIDPANAQLHSADYDLGEIVTQEGERAPVQLSVVEWNLPGKRGVYLCDEQGFMRHQALSRLHFRGFSYTAYLKSAHIERLDREGLLQMEDLSPDLKLLLDAARAKLREHFALREAERAKDILQLWQEEQLYPYDEGIPETQAEETERRIFDIYATHLHQIFPDFAASTPRNKRLILRLLQELVHVEPTKVARILDELLSFPEEKEEEIMELVQG
jgi:hypothetical protein